MSPHGDNPDRRQVHTDAVPRGLFTKVETGNFDGGERALELSSGAEAVRQLDQ